jgi:hypothetical protein
MVGDMAAVAAEMEPFLDEMEFLEAGATLFSRGEPPGEVYIIQSGLIGCQVTPPTPLPSRTPLC